jgi:NhaA family Na+:H+ antiporter
MAHPIPSTPSPVADKLPVARVEVLTRPFARFLAVESAGGVVLLACTLVALILANSPAADWWARLWHTHARVELGGHTLEGGLGDFLVNDVLMTVFFFLVGLEIKRELVAGELRDPRKAALPVAAALGGMLVPAAIYLAIEHGRPSQRGWGVPMATDIAFVVGVMALLGPRVPAGLKILLLSLAIADDIGSVLVIAAFYGTHLDGWMLVLAGAGLAVVYALKRLGARSTWVYVPVGVCVWLAVYKSGVHPTVAGVVLGLMTPTDEWVRRHALRLALTDLLGQMAEGEGEVGNHDLQLLAFAARESVSPVERLETALHPWVGFIVMPLFALANAGVVLGIGTLFDRVAVAVSLGLLVGKPVGVVLFSWVAVRLGAAKLPDGVRWGEVLGGGFLAGIGFTMSLFMAGLALEGEHLAAGKLGTLVGSVVSALVGAAILRSRPARPPA